MCQKFIGILKTFFNYCVAIIQHVVGCSMCMQWIKEHIISHVKGGSKHDC